MAGRLQTRWEVWKELLEAPSMVVEWIRDGVPLEVRGEVGSERRPNRIGGEEEVRWTTQEVWRLCRLGALEPCRREEVAISSPMHLVEKPGPKKFRLVVDQRELNSALPERSFKFEGLGMLLRLLRAGDWMVSWDLQEGYMHLLVREDCRKWMGIEWQGQTYRFRTLTFGMSLSPWFFCKTVRVLLRRWRGQGIRVHGHVDDFLLCTRTREVAEKQRDVCAMTMDVCGWVRAEGKGSWEPTQRLGHLGFILDTQKMMVEVPEAKLTDLAGVLHRIADANRQRKGIRARWVAAVAGKIVSLSLAFGPARLMSRALFGVVDARNRRWWEWDHHVRLSPQAVDDIEWLKENLHRFNGRALVRPAVVWVLEVDASGSVGCGGRLAVPGREEERFRLAWTERLVREWGLWHVNVKELAAVLFGLPAMERKIKDCNLEVRVDSATAKAYLERQGGPSTHRYHSEMMRLVRGIIGWTWQRNVELLQPVWIPGSANAVADWESRRIDWHDWEVEKGWFQRLSARWGEHTVDRFADSNNAKVPRFNASAWCPGAEAVNAFTQDWHGENNWAVPPATLVFRVLALVREQEAEATVVLPKWPAQPWWPLLMQMCQDIVELPNAAFVAGPSGHVEPHKNCEWQ